MKLATAICLGRECDLSRDEPFHVMLACGFTDLHATTFLKAHLSERINNRRITISSGIFGDLIGTLSNIKGDEPLDAIVVMLEWSDLDARLGYRTTHGWRPDCVSNYPETVQARLSLLYTEIKRLSQRANIFLSLPSLPWPPVFITPTNWGDSVSFTLNILINDFAAKTAAMSNLRILNPISLDRLSPIKQRLNLGSDIRSGFPYTLEHTSILCGLISELIRPDPQIKGIITDLDNTLWEGVLGEVGVDGISWDIDHNTHSHALYQEMLASAARTGILIAVASKNDPHLVELAFERSDLVINPKDIYPIEAGWGVKSESVRRILNTWNISADSVVFIDDSPMELAEVASVHSGIRCLNYPAKNDNAVYEFITLIRDMIGKEAVTEEDRLRMASIKASSEAKDARVKMTPDEFLSTVDAELSLIFNDPDERCLELVNKTNQFNLNGRRIDSSTWRSRLADSRQFVLSASYRDKFGPLGKISVVSGAIYEQELRIDIWVMSCRAFSRRIEYHILKAIFDTYPVDMISIDYSATDRNGPYHDFLQSVIEKDENAPFRINKTTFLDVCPKLFGDVVSQ